MYLYVFTILNDFVNLVIWGPWDRETSTMRFSLTMASLNLIVKPFLTPAMLELVKRNGAGAMAGSGYAGGMGGGIGGPPGPSAYPGPPAPYSAGAYGKDYSMGHGGGDDMNAI
jgi:hypothetical protein